MEVTDRADYAQVGPQAGEAPREPSLVREWSDRARPRSHPEGFAVLAAYAEETEGRTLRWDEVRDLFEEPGETPPVNLDRELRRALDQGLREPVGPHPDELEGPRDARFRGPAEGREAAGVPT